MAKLRRWSELFTEREVKTRFQNGKKITRPALSREKKLCLWTLESQFALCNLTFTIASFGREKNIARENQAA